MFETWLSKDSRLTDQVTLCESILIEFAFRLLGMIAVANALREGPEKDTSN